MLEVTYARYQMRYFDIVALQVRCGLGKKRTYIHLLKFPVCLAKNKTRARSLYGTETEVTYLCIVFLLPLVLYGATVAGELSSQLRSCQSENEGGFLSDTALFIGACNTEELYEHCW